jgi:preprotein translocase subunit SecA
MLDDVAARSAQTFRTVPVGTDGANLAAAGVRRPAATWTYLVQDDPFGSPISRAARRLARFLRPPPD